MNPLRSLLKPLERFNRLVGHAEYFIFILIRDVRDKKEPIQYGTRHLLYHKTYYWFILYKFRLMGGIE